MGKYCKPHHAEKYHYWQRPSCECFHLHHQHFCIPITSVSVMGWNCPNNNDAQIWGWRLQHFQASPFSMAMLRELYAKLIEVLLLKNNVSFISIRFVSVMVYFSRALLSSKTSVDLKYMYDAKTCFGILSSFLAYFLYASFL